jgi:DNA-binding SARP family transcriptional activator/WD40 repeat protein
VEFRILGPIEVSEDGSGPIPLGGPKQRAVLAHLLLRANHLVPTEVLIDEVWGEQPPETARNALQSYASHLRKVLGPGRLEGSRAGYRLHVEPTELDAVRFQSLVRDARRLMEFDVGAAVAAFDHALDLWRGPALGDLAAETSLQAEAAKLEDQRLGATEDRIEAQLTAGRHGDVIGDLESLTARHPLRERLWEQLMVALYRSGRQGEALAAYGRAREILAEELGIDPSPELRRTHERVLAQSPDLDQGGEPLRGYRLLERVGEGSFGVLYRATEPRVGREVAVRVVREHIAGDPVFVRRFEPEAQAVAALDHPHTAHVLDYWREPGRAYVVTRFLRATSLRARLEGGPLDGDLIVRVLQEVGSALAAAHRRGVTHGAVEASNVLLDEEGNAYLTDFRIGFGSATPEGDVRDLAALARGMLGDRAPEQVVLASDAQAGRGSTDVAGLLAELSSALGGKGLAEPVVSPAARNPYKGLRPFLEADARDFHGREASVRRLIGRMGGRDARLMAVVGPSGSGKSSLVRAGLVPALRGGALPGSAGWFFTEMQPGAHPFEEAEAALLRVAVRPSPGLLGLLESGPRGLLGAVERVIPSGSELLLVIDQFEEAFTLTEGETERSLLLESVRVATAEPASPLRVVITLRADYYDRPLNYPRFGEALGACTEVVTPLAPDELERAIVRPAEATGLRVEPTLIAQITADVVEQPGALPHVQYALTELFDRRADGWMTLDGYRDIGGVAGALSARAEQIYSGRDDTGREAVRQLLLRLVTLGEGTDARRRVRLAELWAIEREPDAMRSALDAFGRHRLLTFDRDPASREPTVEVAHEALIRSWPRLRDWIDEAREDVRRNRRLADAAGEWERAGRDPGYLLRGSRLGEFEQWADATRLAIATGEREFLQTSIAGRQEEEAAEATRLERERSIERSSVTRLRAFVAVLTVGVLVAGSLTAIALDRNADERRASRLATSRELAGAAAASLENDRDLAVLLALEAMDAVASDGRAVPEAEEVLWQSVPLSAVRSLGGLSGVSITPDLRLVAIAGTEGPTGVWELATGRRLLTVSGRSGAPADCAPADRTVMGHGACDAIFHVSLSPDGTRLATGHGDGDVQIRDAVTGRLVRSIDLVSEAVVRSELSERLAPSVWFSPDGRFLVMGAIGAVSVWDSQTDAIVRSEHQGRGTENVAFTADGSLVAAWGEIIGVGHEGRVIETATGEIVTEGWFSQGRGGPAFAHDGSSVAFAQVLTVRVFAIRGTGEHTAVMEGRTTDFVFSPNDELLAVASDVGKVFLDRAADGDSIGALDASVTSVDALAFSPDGSLLATGDAGGAVKVWDVEDQRQIASIPGHAGAIVELAFSPDGRRLAAVSSDGTVLLHLVRLEDQIELARDRLARGFTDEECRRYLHAQTCADG